MPAAVGAAPGLAGACGVDGTRSAWRLSKRRHSARDPTNRAPREAAIGRAVDATVGAGQNVVGVTRVDVQGIHLAATQGRLGPGRAPIVAHIGAVRYPIRQSGVDVLPLRRRCGRQGLCA